MKSVKNLLSGCAVLVTVFILFIAYTIWYTRPVHPTEIVGTWQTPRITKEEYKSSHGAEYTYIFNSDGTGKEMVHTIGVDRMTMVPVEKRSQESIECSITGSKFNLDGDASNWKLSNENTTLFLIDPLHDTEKPNTLTKR